MIKNVGAKNNKNFQSTIRFGLATMTMYSIFKARSLFKQGCKQQLRIKVTLKNCRLC